MKKARSSGMTIMEQKAPAHAPIPGQAAALWAAPGSSRGNYSARLRSQRLVHEEESGLSPEPVRLRAMAAGAEGWLEAGVLNPGSGGRLP